MHAEIKLLPVSEKGRPPYWNSISGFDFGLCVVIGMLFCICLSHFVVWRSYDVVHFSRWPPAAILDLIWVIFRPPTILKFGLDPIYVFLDIVIHAHFWIVFEAYFPRYGHLSF